MFMDEVAICKKQRILLAKIKGWICQNSKNVKVIQIDTNPSIEHQIAEIEANGTIERDYS